MKKWIWAAAILAAFVAIQNKAHAQELKLEEYLLQVRGNHPGMKGAKEGMQGAEMRFNEGNLQFLPQLHLDAVRVEDELRKSNPTVNGTATDTDKYTAEILQRTPIGLTAKFGYTFLRNSVTDSTFQPTINYDASPGVEVNLPLWRNFMGSEFRAQRDAANAQNKGDFYRQRLAFDGIALEAETAYSGLFFARQMTIARKESLDLSQKLLEWISKRAINELADDNDLNQARAGHEMREIEYLKAQNAELVAARAFNSLRGIESDKVEENLKFGLSPADLSKRAATLVNDKVRAAEQDLTLAKSKMQLGRENVRPVFEIYGKYARNGNDPTRDDALGQSWQNDYTYNAMGMRLEVPLIFWENARVSDGYRRGVLGAELALQRVQQENLRDLNSLYSKIESAQKLVTLSQRLVDTQKKTLERERARHRRGRTSLFQVLEFEQNYVQAQLAQISYQNDLIALTNQLRLYRGE